MSIKKKKKLFEGKSKTLYETDSPDQMIMEFREDNLSVGSKKSKSNKKAIVNNQISAQLFRYVESFNVPTHLVSKVSENSLLIRKMEMFPFAVMIRNIASGSFAKRYGLKEGEALEKPIVEYYMKHETKDDPMVNQHHIVAFNLATIDELKTIERYATKANVVLKSFFIRRGLELVDFKLEFGRYKKRILLGDELSLDSMRLWDSETGDKFDVARTSRLDPVALENLYEEVRRRIFAKTVKEEV
jgi:phosphoribosylaminoimidazole-succinocarboxamide synthase